MWHHVLDVNRPNRSVHLVDNDGLDVTKQTSSMKVPSTFVVLMSSSSPSGTSSPLAPCTFVAEPNLLEAGASNFATSASLSLPPNGALQRERQSHSAGSAPDGNEWGHTDETEGMARTHSTSSRRVAWPHIDHVRMTLATLA
ncbi:hypothetical protein E2562_024406 [Oryza meyeriana var. granulata]|uniref:Uncharacterized protein n=1 Tax=Oryza meyeriana var. granulata TaxID=110450 RepID=A0A6G1EYJ9_9ORYZ|nr:hypothetical protein E2562_024406 [Oryza meyeriana var. granulata]